MMSRVFLAAASTLLAAISVAQTPARAQAGQPQVPASALAFMPKPELNDTLRVTTHIGSFKILPKGYDSLPAGRLEFSFDGTVLISNLAPGSFLFTTGNVRKEYEDKHGKIVYFGKGKILLVGKFESCQWFGRDLDLTFKGSAVVRLIAEFDKHLDTGNFWFEGMTKKYSLQTNLIPITVPYPMNESGKAMKREDYEKMKKKGG